MDVLEKIQILGAGGKFDTCSSSSTKHKVKTTDRLGLASQAGLCQTFTPDGRCVSLFKTLMTNVCSHDCNYCQNSSNCKKKTASFQPQELTKVFMTLFVRNYVEGLFLSSGIAGDADRTTEKMIETVQLLRDKFKFAGYVHFKVLPGTSKELIKQASKYADRLSINLEAPNKSRLAEITSVKDFKIDIIRRQSWIKKIKPPGGQTTQMVIGAVGETDMEVIKMLNWEYENMDLKRGYFSAFIPQHNTPLETNSRAPLERERRLYNVDWLLRIYGLPFSEIRDITDKGMLPQEDPKIALARNFFDGPIDINQASRDELIRVPGIGPIGVHRILQFRKQGNRFRKYEQLHNIGIVMKRAKPFLNVDGKVQKTLRCFA